MRGRCRQAQETTQPTKRGMKLHRTDLAPREKTGDGKEIVRTEEQSAATQEKQLDGANSTDSSSISNGNEAAGCSDSAGRSHSDPTQQNQSTLTEKRLPICKINKPPFRNVRLKTSDHPEEKKEPSVQESNKFEENLTLQNTPPVKEGDPITKPLKRNDSSKGKKDSNKMVERTVSQNPSSVKKPFKRHDSSKSNGKKELGGDLTSQNSSSVKRNDPIKQPLKWNDPLESKKESNKFEEKIVPQNPTLAKQNDPITKPLKMGDPSESKNESKKLENFNRPVVKKSVPVSKPEECPQSNSVNRPRSKHKETMQFYQPPAVRRQESLHENEPSINSSTDEVSQATQKSSHSVKSDPIPVENWDTKLMNNTNNLDCSKQSIKSVPTYPPSAENWDIEIDTKLMNNTSNLDCSKQSKESVPTYPPSAENWDIEVDTKLEQNANNAEYHVQTTEHIPVHNMEVEFVQKQESEANNMDYNTKPSRKNKSKRYSQGRRRDRLQSKEEAQNEVASLSSETAAAKFDAHASVPQQTKSCNFITSEEGMPNFDGRRRQNFGRRRRNDSSEYAVTETQNQLPNVGQRVNVAGHVVHSEMINKCVNSLEHDNEKYTQVNEQFSSSLPNVKLPERLYNSSSMVSNMYPEVSHIEAQERRKIIEQLNFSLQTVEHAKLLHNSVNNMYPEVSHIEARERRKIIEQFSSSLHNMEHSERLHDNSVYSGISHFEARERLKICTPPPGFTPAPQKTNETKHSPLGFPSVSKRREHGNFSEPPPGFPKVPKCTETDAIHKTDQSYNTREQSYCHPELSTNTHYYARERNLDCHDSQVEVNNQHSDHQNDVPASVTRPGESGGTMTAVKSKEFIDYWDLTVESVTEPVNKNNSAFQVVDSQDEEDFDYWDFSGTKKVNKIAPSEMAFLTEVNEDLFFAPNTSSLVHCVAEDLRMSQGIAVDFRQKFGRLPELLNQRCKTGELAVLPDPKDSPVRYIYYLITKPKSTDKPTIQTLESSLQCLREHCDLKNVTQLAMPRIGCGLDLLKWSQVTELLRKIFSNSGISIVVYSQDKAKEDMEDQSIKYFSIKESLNCQLSEKESGTARVFLASEGPMADGTMQDLNVKYRFLSTYETAERSKGSMFRYECKFPHEVLYGLVARGHSMYEPVDFLALDTALRALRKDIKKDDYSYIGIEAYYEENDPMIVEKLVTAIKWVFAKTNVQLHVCWPKTVMMQYGITAN
ncbi:hypothetical protein B566_EDAN013048 [Ephemera danica]|nr:hypothetical protein B566_EDAN013048 [Ephemera danica]